MLLSYLATLRTLPQATPGRTPDLCTHPALASRHESYTLHGHAAHTWQKGHPSRVTLKTQVIRAPQKPGNAPKLHQHSLCSMTSIQRRPKAPALTHECTDRQPAHERQSPCHRQFSKIRPKRTPYPFFENK